MTLRIAAVVGSLRHNSYNRRVAAALVRLAPADLEFFDVPIRDLPLYDQDDDAHPAEAVQQFKAAIEGATGALFVTPEYNRSVPGVLKNALDQGSRPYGKSVWAGRPAGIVGVSPGKVGTATAQQHLRTVLAYLDMPTLGQPEAFIQWTDTLLDADGGLAPGSRAFLQGWMDRFADWIRKHAP